MDRIDIYYTRFKEWLQKEPLTLKHVVLIVLAFFGFAIVWTFTMGYIYAVIQPIHQGEFADQVGFFVAQYKTQPYGFLFLVIDAIINSTIEEVAFRLLPLAIAVRYLNLDRVLAVVIISSVIFAFSHAGVESLALQGVMGLGLSIVFLKCGGLHKKILKPLIASSAAHAMLDSALFLIIFFTI